MARTPAPRRAKPDSDAAVIRRQLAWTFGILALIAALGYGYYWGRELGWGDPAKAIARKMSQGETAFVNGDLEQAARAYATVVKRYPEDPQAVQAMTQEATALQQLGRLSESLGVLMSLDGKLASKGDKSDLKAYTLLQIAKVKKDLNDYSGAMEAYQRVRNEHPHTDWSGEAQSGIGGVLQSQRQFKEARQAYEVLVKELPGGFLAAEAQTDIGECYEAEGNTKAAMRSYKMVMDRYPSAVWDSAKARLEALKQQVESSHSHASSKG